MLFRRSRASTKQSELAALFGAPKKLLADSAITAAPDLSTQLVGYLQPSEAAAAAEYARLTRRSCAQFESVEAALGDQRVAVLMLRFAQLSARTLEVIAQSSFEEGRTAAAGLVLTTDAEGEPVDYTVFAHAYRLSLAAAPGLRTALFPWLPGEAYAAEGDGLVLAAEAEPPIVRDALSRDNALLTIGGHSDGIDLQLAAAASMCGVHNWRQTGAGGVAPRCRQRSWCHRRKLPLQEAVIAPATVGPETIRSRVLLLDSCFGLPMSDRLFHRAFSLFNAILTRSLFGAFVTHCDVTFLDLDNTEDLGDALCARDGVGRGLLAHLRKTRRRGDRPVLVGDPALVLRTAGRLVPRIGENGLRDALPFFSAENPDASALAPVFAGEDEAATALSAADRLLVWMAKERKIEDIWIPRIGVEIADDGPACSACSARTRLYASPAHALPHQRHLLLCPVCGIIADRRSTETALLRHDGESVYSLTANFGQPVRAAALRFEAVGGPDAEHPYVVTSVPWPVVAGVPQPSVALALSPPPGMNRITGLFVHDEDVTTLTVLRIV